MLLLELQYALQGGLCKEMRHVHGHMLLARCAFIDGLAYTSTHVLI